MIIMENHRNMKNNCKYLELLGFGLLRFKRTNSEWSYENVFQKGIGLPLLQNLIEAYKKEIIANNKGHSVIPLENMTVFLQYFKLDSDNIILLVYMDKTNHEITYSDLYLFTKRIRKSFMSNTQIEQIIDLCEDNIEIPISNDLIALFIIGPHGQPLFSQIDKDRTKIANSEVHIGGFISALFSFSQEIIGQESGGNLKEINFGNQRFYLITNNNVIFAFLVEELDDLLERYMYLITNEFVDQYNEVLKSFNGDIRKFKDFEKTLDKYFIL